MFTYVAAAVQLLANRPSLPPALPAMLLSIVIPVYREEENIPRFLARMQPILDTLGIDHEVIFCLDPSPDGSEQAILREGPETVAAFIAEPVQGAGGVIVPPPDYFARIREICTRYDVLFIADEVITGFGRTGRWFGLEHYGVEPDIVQFAKGITSGYVPLGAVLISQKVADSFRDKVFFGGLTYSGHPLACAAGVGAIQAMEEEGVVENAREIGDEVLGPGLRDLMAKHKSIGDVRGRGCFWGVELVKNRETKEMLAPFNASAAQMGAVGELGKAAMQRGLSLMIHWNVIAVAPPLIITPQEARRGLAILDEVLKITDAAAD